MAAVTGTQVAEFLGGGNDSDLVTLAENHAQVLTNMCLAYTRGVGFTAEGVPNAQIASVIVTAAARLVANPEQIATDVGGVSTRGGFNGFNLAELFVLNRYRKQAQ